MRLNTNLGRIEAKKQAERLKAKCLELQARKNKSKTVKAKKDDSKT